MMAFSTSFFTLESEAASDCRQPQQEPPFKEESETAMDGGDHNPSSVADEHTAELPHSPPETMARSEKSRLARPNSEDAGHGAGGDANHTTSQTPKAAASKKKKGTASAVKAPPKRARTAGGAAGTKKAKGGGTKKAKTNAASKQPGTGVNADAGADTADDNGNDSSESDNGPYCLCRGPDDHRFMIACDRCEDWFHGECIGMDKHTGENLVQKYICPNCTDGGRCTTRYKKTCSLSGCNNPARIYDAARPSIFCCSEHCQVWWEQLIATLPRARGAADPDYLTQEEFVGLLDSTSYESDEKDFNASPWKLGKIPFEIPPTFWDSPAAANALTPEEQALLSQSAVERYQLGEEIVLCKKMLQLIDMALKRREAAIAAGRGTAKDLCGYDYRLDAVGTTHQFALFIQSPQGESIFKAGRLEAPETYNDSSTAGTTNPDEADDPLMAGMCAKKKCKPHNGWSAILTKAVKHDMKQLAAQAKEKLDAEQRVRDCAAGRFRRKMKERNMVVVYAEREEDCAEEMQIGRG
ncbi:hypothetical protein VTK56DRAFT_3465 [Thermocarpiscus australiensis]